MHRVNVDIDTAERLYPYIPYHSYQVSLFLLGDAESQLLPVKESVNHSSQVGSATDITDERLHFDAANAPRRKGKDILVAMQNYLHLRQDTNMTRKTSAIHNTDRLYNRWI